VWGQLSSVRAGCDIADDRDRVARNSLPHPTVSLRKMSYSPDPVRSCLGGRIVVVARSRFRCPGARGQALRRPAGAPAVRRQPQRTVVGGTYPRGELLPTSSQAGVCPFVRGIFGDRRSTVRTPGPRAA
jgi:hypothetical protein